MKRSVHLYSIVFETNEHIDAFLENKIEAAIKDVLGPKSIIEEFKMDLVSSYDKEGY